MTNITKGISFKAEQYPDFILELISDGGLEEHTRKTLGISESKELPYMSKSDQHFLDSFFNARSVAIVGPTRNSARLSTSMKMRRATVNPWACGRGQA